MLNGTLIFFICSKLVYCVLFHTQSTQGERGRKRTESEILKNVLNKKYMS
jgi:hypothetical protein